MTLCTEPAGDVGNVSASVVSGISTGRFGEAVFSKIRCFVVVREDSHACTVLPILTYNHMGVSKKGLKKSDHAIVHSGKDPPLLLPSERPAQGELGLLPHTIRVDMDDPSEKLDPMSRVCFTRIYTVEHNIKVRSLGKVNVASMRQLLAQFKKAFLDLPDNDLAISEEIKIATESKLATATANLLDCGISKENIVRMLGPLQKDLPETVNHRLAT